MHPHQDQRDRPSGKRATMTRVAAELGISAMTVSNAYNHPARVAEPMREKIFETAERLGYAGPDPVARALRRSRTNMAGVLYSNPLTYAFDDPAQVLFLKGVAAAAEVAGLGLTLVPGAMGFSAEERAAGAMDAAVDGFVVYSTFDGDPLVEAAIRRRLPMVIVDQPLVEGIPFVGINDESASMDVARHLVGLGHQRFGVVSFTISTSDRMPGIVDWRSRRSADLRVSDARLAGYESVLEAAGIPWGDVPVYQCFGSSKAMGRDAADTLLSQNPRPTAIVALSDQLALGVIEAAAARGLSVPEDLSVVGFDDVPEAIASTPSLTTVYQDHTEKGRLAGGLLVAQLHGQGADDRNVLPTRLVVRSSTGRPPEVR